MKKRTRNTATKLQRAQQDWRCTKGRIGMYISGLNNIAGDFHVKCHLTLLSAQLNAANDSRARLAGVNIKRKEVQDDSRPCSNHQ